MPKYGKIISPDTLVRMIIILQEDLCNGDTNSHRRETITVGEMEKYTEKIDPLYIR